MALSDRFMSGPPLLYILTAISEKLENPPNETVHKGWVQILLKGGLKLCRNYY